MVWKLRVKIYSFSKPLCLQSEVEETIERIKVQAGVEGYVISNKQGQVLRRFPTMPQELAERYSETMISLASQARSVVRDLNPKVCQYICEITVF